MVLRPSDRAWVILTAGIIAWDVWCPPGEMLSEGVDRYMLRHPWITRGVVALVALHLCNHLPPVADPIGYLARHRTI